jgi:Ca2+-binding RTX toxin-like protein
MNSTSIESLENRVLLTGVLNAATGVLTVNGLAGAANDSIQISQTPNVIIMRHFNHGNEVQAWPVTRVRQIVINGFAGHDRLVMDANVTKPGVLFGHDGNDTLVGGAVGDRLFGGNGSDFMQGRTGNDQLDGGLGADNMFGGGGVDTTTYAGRPVSVFVDLDNVADDGQAGEGDNNHTDVENIIGGRANDVLIGSAAANRIFGGEGHDRIWGLGGNDQLFGQNGNDRLIGGLGADFHSGGNDNDLLDARDGAGGDTGDGGAGAGDIALTDPGDGAFVNVP